MRAYGTSSGTRTSTLGIEEVLNAAFQPMTMTGLDEGGGDGERDVIVEDAARGLVPNPHDRSALALQNCYSSTSLSLVLICAPARLAAQSRFSSVV